MWVKPEHEPVFNRKDTPKTCEAASYMNNQIPQFIGLIYFVAV